MNSWQLVGQQNLRNDPARCDENVLLVHNVWTFLCILMRFSTSAEGGSQDGKRWKEKKTHKRKEHSSDRRESDQCSLWSHMQKLLSTQKLHKNYTKITQKFLQMCTSKSVLLIRNQRTTTTNRNTTRAPRRLEPKRMYRLHAQTNVKKLRASCRCVRRLRCTSLTDHLWWPPCVRSVQVRKRLWRKTIGALFNKFEAVSRNALYCNMCYRQEGQLMSAVQEHLAITKNSSRKQPNGM